MPASNAAAFLSARRAGFDGAVPQADARVSRWKDAIRAATAAARRGPGPEAFAEAERALVLAEQLIGRPPQGRADDCVAALVVSRHVLADLCVDAERPADAAAHRASAHEVLMALLLHPDTDEAAAGLARAALRHARETHAALLLHLDECGAHPAIDRALRAGCAVFGAGRGPAH